MSNATFTANNASTSICIGGPEKDSVLKMQETLDYLYKHLLEDFFKGRTKSGPFIEFGPELRFFIEEHIHTGTKPLALIYEYIKHIMCAGNKYYLIERSPPKISSSGGKWTLRSRMACIPVCFEPALFSHPDIEEL